MSALWPSGCLCGPSHPHPQIPNHPTTTHSEHEAGWKLLNHELEDGRSWPFEHPLSLDGFRAYFLSHAAFVVRRLEEGEGGDSSSVLGAFYIKPNFPGRCAHICNGGFITHVAVRIIGG